VICFSLSSQSSIGAAANAENGYKVEHSLRTALEMRSKLQCPAGVAPPEDDTLRMSGTSKVATANASMIA
jgi:hypothetical protein